jgi:hypothetical protein
MCAHNPLPFFKQSKVAVTNQLLGSHIHLELHGHFPGQSFILINDSGCNEMIQQMAFSVHLASSVLDMKLRETVINKIYTLYKLQFLINGKPKPGACTQLLPTIQRLGRIWEFRQKRTYFRKDTKIAHLNK